CPTPDTPCAGATMPLWRVRPRLGPWLPRQNHALEILASTAAAAAVLTGFSAYPLGLSFSFPWSHTFPSRRYSIPMVLGLLPERARIVDRLGRHKTPSQGSRTY